MKPPLRAIQKAHVISATGANIEILEMTTLTLTVGKQSFKVDFLVCDKIRRPCYIGLDFLRKHKVGIEWSSTGKLELQVRNKPLIESIDTHIRGPKIFPRSDTQTPPRSLMILNICMDLSQAMPGLIYDVMPNLLLKETHPNLVTIPLLHNIEGYEAECAPYILVNLSQERIFLSKTQMLGHLEPTSISLEEMTTETSLRKTEIPEEIQKDDTIPLEKKFITSPADVDRHRNVLLQDADIADEYREKFKKLCEKYDDIFSKGPGDIGKTPLITMEIDTGDSPPVCQRPYNLPLKHADWVKKELETLEKAGIISRSVSPWASPIVIVPKKTEPGEPPKKRLCVDYRVINSLIPTVTKAHSRAKGVLTLVPLPKIDEIYARLRGSAIYSAMDMTSGYHHMELSAEAKPKSAFVTPVDKYEFNRCPFGLAQAPAYFQRLVNKVLAELPFTF